MWRKMGDINYTSIIGSFNLQKTIYLNKNMEHTERILSAIKKLIAGSNGENRIT